jgi:preprotein translocase subunit Sss1
MVEPVTTVLTGIALVTKSVEFIKSNIQTAQDIGQFVGAIENAFEGEKQCLKARDKSGAGTFATENVAQEIIDAKLAREHLNEMKNLINLRFGPSTWDEILTERKRRIDAKKQAIREERARRQKQAEEIGEIIKWGGIGITFVGFIALVIYIMIILMKPARAYDECIDFKTDVFICLNEGADATYARYGREYKGKLPRSDMFTMCRLKKQEWFVDDKGGKDMSYKCTYEHPQDLPDLIMTTGPRYQCPRNIQCKVK